MKKTNSKGFSLVELIIVIAIMAVLTGISAPFYLRFVEKAHIQKAISNTQTVADAINIVLVDTQAFEDDVLTKIKVFITNGTTINLDGDEASFIRNVVDTDDLKGSVKFMSSESGYITFTYTSSDGKYSVDYKPTDTDSSGKAYIYETGDYHVFLTSSS